MLFARRLQVVSGRDSIICDSVRIIQKGALEAKKDNESVVVYCIYHFESTLYPQSLPL
jgi:hypothetical protein